MAAGAADAERLRDFGLNIDTLDTEALAEREPYLIGAVGGVHYLDAASVDDPSRLAQAYAELFKRRGGRFFTGDAHSLQEAADGRWSVGTHEGHVNARDLVVSLGPWSDLIFRELGYDFPLAFKRGYHMHYAPREGAVLAHPVLDADNGYVLAPMTRGIRLTTGAEFLARRAANARADRTDRADRAKAVSARRTARHKAVEMPRSGPACRTCCQSLARPRATSGCGFISATSIMDLRWDRCAGDCSRR